MAAFDLVKPTSVLTDGGRSGLGVDLPYIKMTMLKMSGMRGSEESLECVEELGIRQGI